jgi:hypothetical protein
MCLEIREYPALGGSDGRAPAAPRSTAISEEALSSLYAIPATMLATPSASSSTVTLLA